LSKDFSDFFLSVFCSVSVSHYFKCGQHVTHSFVRLYKIYFYYISCRLFCNCKFNVINC